MKHSGLNPVFSSFEDFAVKGWNVRSESAVLALSVFATLCVTIVVVLMVCVSAEAAGIFTVSIGGLLAALGFTHRQCSRFAEPGDPDLEPPPPERSRLGRCSQRGSSVVELAFIYPVVFTALAGVFGLGQALYTYNLLQSATRSAARYASLAPYDLPNGATWKKEVRNMAVYGEPAPLPTALPLVPGLTVGHVNASAYIPEGEPTIVTVAVSDFELDFVFYELKVSQPVVKFPFLGRALMP